MFAGAAVLVFGDVMLDHYVEGEATRLSPEAPVPVVRLRGIHSHPGGAGNVALGAAALGCEVTCVGVTGDDPPGREFAALMAAAGVAHHSVVASDRPTTEKWRVLAGRQQLLRVDSERTEPVDDLAAGRLTDILRAWLQRSAAHPRAAVISDYGKGAVRRDVAAVLDGHALIVVDPHGRDCSRYPQGAVWKPNRVELDVLCPPSAADPTDGLRAQAEDLMSASRAAGICVTLGGAGMAVATPGTWTEIPAEADQVRDVTGAGDTVAAVLAASLASGAPLVTAARLANRAAGLAVSCHGTCAVSAFELEAIVPAEWWQQHRMSRSVAL